jgi:signal transduction histidine kinase
MLDRLKGFLERERRFTQAAAHELRTPLAGARAQLEALERGFLPPEEALPALKAELARLERLVEGLLILARENRVDRVELDLALLAQEAARRYGVPYEGPERLPFQGDPILLGRALENLLENALRHGEGKGVKVRLEGRALCVEDQGPGLSEEERALAQTPFWRKGKAPGEGLGLAVAAQVAEAHGGRLLLLPNTPQGLRACLDFGGEKTA